MTAIDLLLSSSGRPFVADAGLETAMIFHDGFDLPHFASFVLLDSEAGRAALTRWFDGFAALARNSGTGLFLDTATWRANMGWAPSLGLDEEGVSAVNRHAAAFATGLRDRYAQDGLPVLVNGAVGPSGDGYSPARMLTPEAAEALHRPQIRALVQGGVDMVSAITMTHTGEALGIARAATAEGIPFAISFTVETDGRLPSGQDLHDALAEIEEATGGAALFYMVNCAHPTHFAREIGGPMLARIGGIRANASRLSHAELDAATELDDGDPVEFGHLYAAFARFLPALRVIGGCCGTDHRHVSAACAHVHRAAA
ncbi:MAG: homocysteine S-methyltransferase family protein [Rhodobacteraceae bacterium]|nr:homocysteine S-methyltransferase family protein [Paracoccaceae bacterium]